MRAQVYILQKKEALKHRYRRIGFFFRFFPTMNLRPILSFFVISLVIITLRYLIPFIHSLFPFAISPPPTSSCSLLCGQALSTPCSLGAVPTTPQAAWPFPHICSLSLSTQAFQQIDRTHKSPRNNRQHRATIGQHPRHSLLRMSILPYIHLTLFCFSLHLRFPFLIRLRAVTDGQTWHGAGV